MNPITARTWDSLWPAPAKLNLFLHVVGRRADGYHLLQTVFRFIDDCDWLRFQPRNDGRIVLATPLPGITPERELSFRAAQLLQQQTGSTQGVEISIDKRLPQGGGLGGGSSDAATTLLALNHLWQLGLDRKTLQAIGLNLGADVPIFIYGRNAFAGGIGEELNAVDLPERWYVVVEPPIQIPTALIFSDPNLCRTTAPIDPNNWQFNQPSHNDLQPVAIAHYPLLGNALAQLSEQAGQTARMTGSGSCIFAEFDDRNQAQTTAQRLAKNWQCHAVAGLAAHPLSEPCSCQEDG